MPSGTNLLGLVKHLVGVEYVYLGTSVGRPPEKPAVGEDGRLGGRGHVGAAVRVRDYLTGLYREACATDTARCRARPGTPGEVPHRRGTAYHAGTLLVREVIDGQGGADADMLDAGQWSEYYTKIQRAAETS